MQSFPAPPSHTFASIHRFFMHLLHACAAFAPQQFKSHSALTPLTLVLVPCYPARIARRVLASALHLNISPQIALSTVAAAASLLCVLQWKRLDALNRDSVRSCKSSAELACNYRMHSAFIVFTASAFAFVSMAKLLVLDHPHHNMPLN